MDLFCSGGSSKRYNKTVECWGADKPFANITENNLTAKSIALTVRYEPGSLDLLNRKHIHKFNCVCLVVHQLGHSLWRQALQVELERVPNPA